MSAEAHAALYNHCTNLCTQILNVNHINLTEQIIACAHIFVLTLPLLFEEDKRSAQHFSLHACKDVF